MSRSDVGTEEQPAGVASPDRWSMLAVTAAMALLALWPLWSDGFVPMQDYPQHLVQAQMVVDQHDPALDYRDHFDIDLKLAPYSTFYLLTIGFGSLTSIEIGGRAAISLYVLLTALLVWKLVRRASGSAAPWGLLLLFPALLNQQYYFGNLNYLLSLPLLLLALLDHRDLARSSGGVWPWLRHAGWLSILFATHPLSFLAYAGLAGAGSLLEWRDKRRMLRAMVAPTAGALLFVIWFALRAKAPGATEGGVMWIGARDLAMYFALPFTGMTWNEGIDWLCLGLWIATLLLGVLAVRAAGVDRRRILDRNALYLLLTVAAFLVLPFRVDDYSFINARLAAVIYLLLALVYGRIPFHGGQRWILVALVVALQWHGLAKQGRIAAEIAEIEPLLIEMQPNAGLMPLVFEAESLELEQQVFDVHQHVYNYYHTRIGGGFSPYFPRQPLTPVHLKPEAERPSPGEYAPHDFRWRRHAADYRYFLLRGTSAEVERELARHCNEPIRSGAWTLYQRR